VVLDLDQTLIHATPQLPTTEDDHYFATTDRDGKVLYVHKRPYVDEFLFELRKYADLLLYTSARKEYADAILSQVDPLGSISKRFYREVFSFFDH